MFKYLLLIFISMALISCGQSTEEEVDDAINEANFLLTDGKCSQARTVLDGIGYQNKNTRYLIAYASTYACDGNYSTTTLFATDLPSMGTAQSAIIGDLAIFSTSNMTTSADSNFTAIQNALDTLWGAGGITEYSHANRDAVSEFTPADVNNMDVFALYLTLVQMGKFARYYGDANATGAKGANGNNDCYLTYTDADAITIADAVGGDTCNSGTLTGNTDLDASRELQCFGIVMFNNFLDILANVTFTGTNADGLTQLSTTISDLCATAGGTYDLGNTCVTKNLSTCVNDTTNHSAVQIQRFYAAVYDAMHVN